MNYSVVGKWKSDDTNYSVILIQQNGNEMTLTFDTVNPRINTYYFMSNDTITTGLNRGVLMRWPPQYCYLEPVDENYLKVIYTGIGLDSTLVEYSRFD